MRNIFKVIIGLLLTPLFAFAQDDITLGFTIGNGRLLGAKTYDGQTTVGILGIDSSGNTVIKAISGKTISFTNAMTPATDNALDVGSASLGYRTGYFDTSVVSPLITNSGDLVLRTDDDAQRVATLSAGSDTAMSFLFGLAAATATTINLGPNSTDTADSNIMKIQGAGSASDSRGSYTDWNGNEVAGVGGSILNQLGNDSDAVFYVLGSNASSFAQFQVPIRFSDSGDTIAFQEATSANTCQGSITANGTTAVTVATTCAKTGARVVLTRSSAPSGTAQCWYDTIVNNTSFNLDCDGAETGTFTYQIFHETP